MQSSIGLEGVAAASVLSLGLYTIALGVTWYRDPDHRGRVMGIIDGVGRALPLAVAGGSAAWGATRIVEGILGGSFAASVVTLLTGYVVFAGVALGLAVVLYELSTRSAGHPSGLDELTDE